MQEESTTLQPEPEVRDRAQFPLPRLTRIHVGRAPVVLSDGTISEKTVLVSSNRTYELGRKLKESIYGQVSEGVLLTLASNGTFERYNPTIQVAIKFYSRSKLQSSEIVSHENPIDEIAAMQYLKSHPNIMTAFEYCCDVQENIYTIMEYVEGRELFEIVSESGALAEDHTREIFRQILHGVAHIHSAGVGHRDLSLENVIVSTSTGVCKVIDFGMSILVPISTVDGVVYKIPPQGACGKKNYVSPEVLENAAPFNPLQSDLWALGIILFIMLTGVPPVGSPEDSDPRYRMIASNRLTEMLEHWDRRLSDEAVDLLANILRPDPMKRFTVSQMLNHPWMIRPNIFRIGQDGAGRSVENAASSSDYFDYVI